MTPNAAHERMAAAALCVLSVALALPYWIAGPNFILDDWFSVGNSVFDGAWSAGGTNLHSRPGAWVISGLTFGAIGNHPLPIFVIQTAVNAATALMLLRVLRRFLPLAPAAIATGLWVVLPTHTALDNWASALNIAVALLAVLAGVGASGRSPRNWRAALWFAVAALCYEATIPVAAVAVVAVPLLERRRPRLADDLALPLGALGAVGVWILFNWQPAKHVGGWVDLSPVLDAHFGSGVVGAGRLAQAFVVLTFTGTAWALARLTLSHVRSGAPEATVLAGVVVMALGVVPFLRYLYEPFGAGDRANVVSAVGAALVLTGLGWMATQARPTTAGRVLVPVLAVVAVVGVVRGAQVNVHRDVLYARAGQDVLRTMHALDRAIPHPDGPIAIGPTPLVRDNIVGLLDRSNVDGALEVHRGRRDVHGFVTLTRAEWNQAPPQLRFDQRPCGTKARNPACP